MKKLLLIIVFLASGIWSQAQTYDVRPTVLNTITSPGFYIDPATSNIWLYKGSGNWINLGSRRNMQFSIDSLSNLGYKKVEVDNLLSAKVDKITGKGLSEADVTASEKTAITHSNRTALDAVSGTNTGDNAVNSQYSGLTNYTHPANHPPSIITQDASNRFTTDTEKGHWNTAFSWGNHAAAGYGLASALTSHATLTTTAHGLGSSAFHPDSFFQLALTNPITGIGTAGYLPKLTGSSTLESSPVYTDGTKISIGTSITDKLLYLYGANAKIRLQHNVYDAGELGIEFSHRQTGLDYTKTAIVSISESSIGYGISSLYFLLNNIQNAGNYSISDARMAIRNNGFVGVGYITDPSSGNKFAVNGAGYFGGSVTAASFIKSGGTSAQYLLADGSVTTVAGAAYKDQVNGSNGLPIHGGAALVDGVGTTGWYYACSTAGTRNYGSGNIVLAVGDQLYYNGAIWLWVPGAGSYTLPIAGSVLGGVKSSASVAVDGSGVMSVSTAYDATGTASGLLSTHNSTYNHANIANGQTAYGWGDWHHTTLSGYGITDALPYRTFGTITNSNVGDYIQNQNTSVQSANMWIDGIGKFGSFTDGFITYSQARIDRANEYVEMQFAGTGGVRMFNNTNPIRFDPNGVITTIGGNSTGWNAAYNWGNHAGLYRTISYVPTWAEITSKPTTLSQFANDLGNYGGFALASQLNGVSVDYIPRWDGGKFINSSNMDDGISIISGALNHKIRLVGTGGGTNFLQSYSNVDKTSYPLTLCGYNGDNIPLFNINAGSSIFSGGITATGLQINGNIATTGTISALGGNSTQWNIAYGWGDWHHTTLSGYGITDALPYRTFGSAANNATGDFVAYRTFGTAANSASTDFEPTLGNPSTTGYILSSNTSGTRSWIPNTGGASGTYTPSYGSISNITGSVNTVTAMYSRTGNICHVAISGNFTATTGGSMTQFNVSIPISTTSTVVSGVSNISNYTGTTFTYQQPAKIFTGMASGSGVNFTCYPNTSGDAVTFSIQFDYAVN